MDETRSSPLLLPSCCAVAVSTAAAAWPSPSTASWRHPVAGSRMRSPPATRSRSSVRLAVGEGAMTHIPASDAADALVIAGRRFTSRLLLGTGGYPNQQVMLD